MRKKFRPGDKVVAPYSPVEIRRAEITKVITNYAYIRFAGGNGSDKSKKIPLSKLRKSGKVIIIESMGESAYDRGISEGRLLQEFLKMIGCEPEYYFIRTKEELKHFFKLARKSKAEHIHLSCHGERGKIKLVLQYVSLHEFIKNVGELKGKVVFASCCLTGDKHFGETFVETTKCKAFISPLNEIAWSDAALISQLFYKKIFCDGVSSKVGYRFIKNSYKRNAGLKFYQSN